MDRKKNTGNRSIRPEKKRSVNKRPEGRVYSSPIASDFRIQQRHNQRIRQRRLKIKRRRAALGMITAVAVVLIIMFLTPLFRIQTIHIEGNNRVSSEEIYGLLEGIEGRNLFRTNASLIKSALKPAIYIDDASVEKKLIPPSLTVTVIEREPYGYIDKNGRYYIFDNKCRILEDRETMPTDIPQILGADDTFDEKNNIREGYERTQAMMSCLNAMKTTDLLSQADDLDVSDLANITFVYGNRMKVECGSDIDIEQKLRLFKAAVTNAAIPENARGTMDLSVTGNAMYSP